MLGTLFSLFAGHLLGTAGIVRVETVILLLAAGIALLSSSTKMAGNLDFSVLILHCTSTRSAKEAPLVTTILPVAA